MSLPYPFPFWVVVEQKGNEVGRSLCRWPSLTWRNLKVDDNLPTNQHVFPDAKPSLSKHWMKCKKNTDLMSVLVSSFYCPPSYFWLKGCCSLQHQYVTDNNRCNSSVWIFAVFCQTCKRSHSWSSDAQAASSKHCHVACCDFWTPTLWRRLWVRDVWWAWQLYWRLSGWFSVCYLRQSTVCMSGNADFSTKCL